MGEGAWSFRAFFRAPHCPQDSTCPQTWKLSSPCPFGFLWGFIVIIDKITGHWRLNSISSPSPWGGTESSNSQNHLTGFPGNQPQSRSYLAFPKVTPLT